MPRAHKPRSGSLQVWPRKRAKRIYTRIRNWPKTNDIKLQCFAGYKAGMTHLLIKDTNPNSPTKNENIFVPSTIIECPPLKPYSIKLYKKTTDGLKLITELINDKLNKEVSRKLDMPKKKKSKEDVEKRLEEATEVRLLAYTQPSLTGIGKKKPELIEINLGNSDIKEQFKLLLSLFDKDIKVSEVFKEGQFIDAHSVSIGKGLQGPVKRFGIALKSHKSEKKRRSPGNLGSWTPKKVSWRIPQKGQMGFHTRTDYNKLVLKISNDIKEINPKQGIHRYGKVNNEYLLIKGSVPGPKKRLIKLVPSIRYRRDSQKPQIAFINK